MTDPITTVQAMRAAAAALMDKYAGGVINGVRVITLHAGRPNAPAITLGGMIRALPIAPDPTERKLALAVEALRDAADCIEAWGAYASEYFQNKHDLKGDVARVRSAAAAIANQEQTVSEQTNAARDVLAERERQKTIEGWTPEHDDKH